MQGTPKRERDSRSLASEARFRQYLAEQGAEPLDDWLGVTAWHRVRCAAGHGLVIRPHKALRLARLCRACKPPARSGRSRQAEARFRARLTELGAELLDEWRGAAKPHRVSCAAGHESFPRPGDVANGTGICVTCSGLDTRQVEATFRSRLNDLGWTLIEPRWLGATRAHLIRCEIGHEMRKLASSVLGKAPSCLVCIRRDPATAEAAFRLAVSRFGGEVLEPKWLGTEKPHRVRCAQGHVVTPRPHALAGGQGMCRKCKGKDPTAFYIAAGAVGMKLGVTSGDGSRRLDRHKRDGFIEVVRLIVGLPSDEAPTIERVCLSAMADAGIAPIRGREYFPTEALPVALDVVDGWFPKTARLPGVAA